MGGWERERERALHKHTHHDNRQKEIGRERTPPRERETNTTHYADEGIRG